ncbi:glucooligosaccharide oxidase [Mycena amicta]|nr:glucooligosaccharide oxidase [Mycena amicta]
MCAESIITDPLGIKSSVTVPTPPTPCFDKLHTRFLLCSLGFLANPLASSTLVSCLAEHKLTVETSQSPAWQASTTPPPAIVYPTNTTQVAQAVKCAIQHGIRVSPLSGGHSYSASGFGNRSLVVNLSNMSQLLRYNPSDRSIDVQPGIRLGDFALRLTNRSGLWPMASVPYTKYLVQSLCLRMELFAVSAKRKIENSSGHFAEPRHSFGIVTQYKVQTHEAPASVVRFALNFNLADRPPQEYATEFSRLLTVFQNWGLTAPKEMGVFTNIWQGGRDIEMTGYYMGNMTAFMAKFQPLLDATGQPNATYIQERGWIEALTEASGGKTLSTVGTPDIHDTFYAKSLTVRNDTPLTTEALAALANFFMSTTTPSELTQWFIQFELWGGVHSAVSSVSSDATAFPHRSHLLTVQFYGRSSSSWSPACTDYVDGLVLSVTSKMPQTNFGSYANYLDPGLEGWQQKYYCGEL